MNLSMIRGNSKTWAFPLRDAADNAIDLTGALGITMTAKSLYTDSDPGVFQKTVGDGITVLDDAAGLIEVALEPADTSDLLGKKYRLLYDIQVQDMDGNVSTPVRGRLMVEPDVTTTIEEMS